MDPYTVITGKTPTGETVSGPSYLFPYVTAMGTPTQGIYGPATYARNVETGGGFVRKAGEPEKFAEALALAQKYNPQAQQQAREATMESRRIDIATEKAKAAEQARLKSGFGGSFTPGMQQLAAAPIGANVFQYTNPKEYAQMQQKKMMLESPTATWKSPEAYGQKLTEFQQKYNEPINVPQYIKVPGGSPEQIAAEKSLVERYGKTLDNVDLNKLPQRDISMLQAAGLVQITQPTPGQVITGGAVPPWESKEAQQTKVYKVSEFDRLMAGMFSYPVFEAGVGNIISGGSRESQIKYQQALQQTMKEREEIAAKKDIVNALFKVSESPAGFIATAYAGGLGLGVGKSVLERVAVSKVPVVAKVATVGAKTLIPTVTAAGVITTGLDIAATPTTEGKVAKTVLSIAAIPAVTSGYKTGVGAIRPVEPVLPKQIGVTPEKGLSIEPTKRITTWNLVPTKEYIKGQYDIYDVFKGGSIKDISASLKLAPTAPKLPKQISPAFPKQISLEPIKGMTVEDILPVQKKAPEKTALPKLPKQFGIEPTKSLKITEIKPPSGGTEIKTSTGQVLIQKQKVVQIQKPVEILKITSPEQIQAAKPAMQAKAVSKQILLERQRLRVLPRIVAMPKLRTELSTMQSLKPQQMEKARILPRMLPIQSAKSAMRAASLQLPKTLSEATTIQKTMVATKQASDTQMKTLAISQMIPVVSTRTVTRDIIPPKLKLGEPITTTGRKRRSLIPTFGKKTRELSLATPEQILGGLGLGPQSKKKSKKRGT